MNTDGETNVNEPVVDGDISEEAEEAIFEKAAKAGMEDEGESPETEGNESPTTGPETGAKDPGEQTDKSEEAEGGSEQVEEAKPAPEATPVEQPKEPITPPQLPADLIPQSEIQMKTAEELVNMLKDLVIKSGTDETMTFEELVKEFPAMYGMSDAIILKRLEPIIERINAHDKMLKAQAEAEKEIADRRLVEESKNALDKAIPGARAIVESNEFLDWFGKQPNGVQKLGLSNDIEDCKALVVMYKNSHPQVAEKEKKIDVRKELMLAGRSTGSRTFSKNYGNRDLTEEEEEAIFAEASK